MSKTAYLVTAGALLTACSSEAPKLTAPIAVPVVSQAMQAPNGSAGAAAANGGNFGTPLSAAEEVMPAGVVNESLARGNAIFQLNAEGTALSYRLSVANIENVFMAHIHRGPVGTNGPIVVWLFPSTAPVQGATGGGRVDGVIAVLCPVASDTLSGVAIMTVPSEEAREIMDGDPCVRAGMMRCEVHACHGFPGDTLPA